MQHAFHLCFVLSLPELDVDSGRLRSIDSGRIFTAACGGGGAVTILPICHRHDCVSSKYSYSFTTYVSTVLGAPNYSNALYTLTSCSFGIVPPCRHSAEARSRPQAGVPLFVCLLQMIPGPLGTKCLAVSQHLSTLKARYRAANDFRSIRLVKVTDCAWNEASSNVLCFFPFKILTCLCGPLEGALLG